MILTFHKDNNDSIFEKRNIQSGRINNEQSFLVPIRCNLLIDEQNQ